MQVSVTMWGNLRRFAPRGVGSTVRQVGDDATIENLTTPLGAEHEVYAASVNGKVVALFTSLSPGDRVFLARSPAWRLSFAKVGSQSRWDRRSSSGSRSTDPRVMPRRRGPLPADRSGRRGLLREAGGLRRGERDPGAGARAIGDHDRWLPWACRRCRGVPSEASREGKLERAERLWPSGELDRRRGRPPGRSRPGESWAEELRRQQRAAAARRLVEASAMTRLGRVLNFRPPRPG